MRAALLAFLVLGLNSGCAKHTPPITDPTIVIPSGEAPVNVDRVLWVGFFTVERDRHEVTFLQWTGEGYLQLMPATTVTGKISSDSTGAYYAYAAPGYAFLYTEVRQMDGEPLVVARIDDTCNVLMTTIPASYPTDGGSVVVYKASLMEGRTLSTFGSDCSVLEQQGN